MERTRWGIIAPGKIAAKFADALHAVDSAELYAVASRSSDRARAFAETHGASQWYADYTELVKDQDVDIVYVASPHTFHAEQATLALTHKKPVLCEKPVTLNYAQAAKLFDQAKLNNVFCMEAVWTRFMPVFEKISDWIASGQIGEVQMIRANFGFSFEFDPKGRLFDPNLGGGSLLDLGIYPITFAQLVLKDSFPKAISAVATKGVTGVDENLGMLLQYESGVIATLSSTTRANTAYTATILGTKGKIEVPMFWCSESAELYSTNRAEEILVDKAEFPHFCNGYEWEIQEAQRCLVNRRLESEKMTWQSSLGVMKIMDEVRAQINLSYPNE